MHRNDLLENLGRHRPLDSDEAESTRRTIEFVRTWPDCFERSLSVGHVTGAAWLLDPSGEYVLLTHHRKLDMWLQLGGHADGDPDVLAVALREAQEESGLDAIVPLSTEVFDVDVHEIPACGGDAAHLHFDVRFLLQAQGSLALRVSEESVDLRWFSVQELRDLPVDHSVRRMSRKWESWQEVRSVGTNVIR